MKNGVPESFEDEPAIIEYWVCGCGQETCQVRGKICRLEWFQNGSSWRNSTEDLPHTIEYHKNGMKMCEEWNRNLDDPRPNLIRYDMNGRQKIVRWNRQSQTRQIDIDLPQSITYDENGNVFAKLWTTPNEIHLFYYSPDGRTIQKMMINASEQKVRIIAYHQNGNVETIQYFTRGVLHQEDDIPSVLNFNPEGRLKSLIWFKNGVMSRENDKPFHIELNDQIDQIENERNERVLFTISEKGYLFHSTKASLLKDCVGQTCAITFETFEDDDDVIQLKCNHMFKSESFCGWAKVGKTCPCCRKKFIEDFVPFVIPIFY